MNDDEMPSKAEHLASVLRGSGTSRFVATARPVLVRLPETVLAEVDAMAQLSSKSRNAMVTHLLDVAIEEVRKSLDDDTGMLLNAAVVNNHMNLQADTADQETLIDGDMKC